MLCIFPDMLGPRNIRGALKNMKDKTYVGWCCSYTGSRAWPRWKAEAWVGTGSIDVRVVYMQCGSDRWSQCCTILSGSRDCFPRGEPWRAVHTYMYILCNRNYHEVRITAEETLSIEPAKPSIWIQKGRRREPDCAYIMHHRFITGSRSSRTNQDTQNKTSASRQYWILIIDETLSTNRKVWQL